MGDVSVVLHARVVGWRYVLSLSGSPPRKNRRHVHVGRGRRANSPEFTALVRAMGVAWGGEPKIEAGIWEASIVSRWPRKRNLSGVDGRVVALGDVDAPVSFVLDALQAAGVIDDDARIVTLAARKEWSATWPGVRVELARIGEVPL